jgi:PncC family amidohydrolase
VAVADTADELTPLIGLAQSVGEALRGRGLTLSTAESCTGGLIGHLLTEISGSSDYYLGGLVSYSDALKQRELGVDAAVLAKHGAVSAQTCVAMAQGARRRYGTDVAIAVTGVAGPGGGTDAKPVGLTYVAVADGGGHDVQRHLWSGDRHANKVASAEAALNLLVARLGR